MIPYNLNKNTNGSIEKRQTTYVRIKTSDGKEYKISYQNKKEYLLEQGSFKGISFDPKHPLLEHYRDDFLNIYISSKLENPDELIIELRNLLENEYKGWRDFSKYFNSQYDISKLIQEGFGLLYDGPATLGFKISNSLKKYNIIHNFQKCKNYRKPNMKVLIIGDNIIVAENFQFEVFKP